MPTSTPLAERGLCVPCPAGWAFCRVWGWRGMSVSLCVYLHVHLCYPCVCYLCVSASRVFLCLHVCLHICACVCIFVKRWAERLGGRVVVPDSTLSPVPLVLDTQGMELGAAVGSLEGWVPETRVWIHHWLLQASTPSYQEHTWAQPPDAAGRMPLVPSSPGGMMGT